MPSAPELTDILRNIRVIKVFQKVKSNHSAQSDGHVRITGKVVIYLKSIGKNTHPGSGSAHPVRTLGKNGVCIFSQHIGYQNFFAQPKCKSEETGQAIIHILIISPVFKLISYFIKSNNRACNKLRKHQNIKCKIAHSF